ncbi:MAG: aminotransferase class I/II-fold pyridoxal phosphate-dependent enzyme [Candidatus Magasanikbacteria bacterium]|nr:aminotransferase class I/II-fold pyridoxal phosphate-dependent enzyme [Candidatus Magasanikbacteria bacterium]
MRFAQRTHIQASATVTINGLALKKRAAGERVFNLSAGEPMVNTNSFVLEAARKAMEEGRTHYTPVPGISELRSVASVWMNRFYQSDFSQSQTLVSAGGKSAYHLAVQALVEPGDEVIMIAPYWVSYSSIVELYGGTPIVVSTKESDHWKLSPEGLIKLCTGKTKLFVLNNASNPTGVLYTREELKALLQIAAERGIFVISDEVYGGLVYDDHEFVSVGSFREYKDKVAIIQSASKQFAMTGWRLGFAFGPEEFIKVLITLQGQDTTCASSISQYAALAAFQNADKIIPAVRGCMQERRNVFVQSFNELFPEPIDPPLSSLYCFIPIRAFGSSEINSVAFCERVLKEANVAMVPGMAFGTEAYVRCSFGEEAEELTAGLQALGEYLSKY